MFKKVTGILSRKVIVAVLLIVIAVSATAGGIKYYRYKSIQPVLQSKAYQTAVKLIGMERYPKLALTPEQALKLLPVVRELTANPADVAGDAARTQAILEALNPEQKDFLNYPAVKNRGPGNPVIPGSLRNRAVQPGTSVIALTPQDKDIVLPILKEISQKPGADEAYLAQKAVELKVVLAGAGVEGSFVETNKGRSQLYQGKRRDRDKGRQEIDKANRARRPWQGGRLAGGKGLRVYDELLEVLLQKAYS